MQYEELGEDEIECDDYERNYDEEAIGELPPEELLYHLNIINNVDSMDSLPALNT